MHHQSIAEQIIALKKEDLECREKLIRAGQLGPGYHPEMERVHMRNADALEDIINRIGYPTIDKVGQAATEAAWLIIQHAISRPDFMRKCRDLLEVAVQEKKAAPKSLAYLSDRIAAFEGKPQLYGTQFDWDADGELSPQPFDDRAKVDQRRAAIGLNTLDAQTKIIRQQAKEEHQLPPPDFDKRNREAEAWRKSVGWMRPFSNRKHP